MATATDSLPLPQAPLAGWTTHAAKIINDPSTPVILATGLGAVDTTVNDGDVPSVITSNTLATAPTVMVGGVPRKWFSSGMVGRDNTGKAFGFVGVYQLNVRIIAPGTPTGNAVPLQTGGPNERYHDPE